MSPRGWHRTGYLPLYILKIGAQDVHLAGSGPALFTFFEDKAPAEELVTRLKNQGMEVFLTDTRASL